MGIITVILMNFVLFFNFFRQDRRRRRGGRVGVCVRDTLNAEVVQTLNHDVGVQNGHGIIV